jgi:vacuolar-type H+-ATPase subunit I/STV1
VARSVSKALSRQEALKAIAGDDPRPLLVLRECKVCNGTDDALLKGGIDNEKTFLLARWFHCVKLPVDVMEEDHPFHNAFTIDPPEHLFVCSVDGTNHDPLESDTSRVQLWKSLKGLIAAEYKGKADSSVKKIASIIDKLDVVDERHRDVVAKRNAILEKEGPKSRKLAKFDKQINKCEAERQKLFNTIEKATQLELKRRTHAKEISEAVKDNAL